MFLCHHRPFRIGVSSGCSLQISWRQQPVRDPIYTTKGKGQHMREPRMIQIQEFGLIITTATINSLSRSLPILTLSYQVMKHQ